MRTFPPICRKVAAQIGQASRSLVALAALGLPLLAQAQTASFPRNASFTDNNASGFTLGGSAFLTAKNSSAAGGIALDASGSGALRLTDAIGNQAGYAIDNSIFSTPNGFSISFEFFSYGSTSTTNNVITPADGFSVFLVDGANTNPLAGEFKIGGTGGSLGYAANTNTTPANPGVTKGYLGIGLDEYGNYSNPTEGRNGGPGFVSNVVALRGDYSSNYNYLTGTSITSGTTVTSTLGTTLTVAGTTRTTTPTNANYRKAYINVVPTTTNGVTLYKITIRIQNGQAVTTAINSFTVTNPPATLRIGFGASTGGSNAIHEIRGLAIVQAPIAVDDNAKTPYNKPVTFSVLANDLNGGGANIAPATVDLNPGTIGRDNSYTVPGQGTFAVDDAGIVTFTPIGSFSGTVSIPYTVQNQNDDISNLGTITVVVTGADVETVVSGPTTVNPGTTTSYAVTTTNNGVETATNVTPTLTLPTGATYVSGGTRNGSTVSFPQVTLAAGQSATSSVTIIWPTAGSYALTSSYAYPSGAVVPDAVATNNSSTLAVTVGGSANIAGVCAVPGKDGPATLGAGTTPNTYYAGVATAADKQTLTVSTTPTGSAAPIATGDILLLMQMQGATMSTANNATYGTVSAATAGTYEYAVAAGPVSTTGSLALARPLTNTYTYTASTSTSIPFQQFQVIRIPQYSALTVSGAVTGLAWNGSTGGVLALEVAGAAMFNPGASLTMDGKGFRGGVAITNGSDGANSDYLSSTADSYSSKGEGIGGSPFQVYSNNAASSGGPLTYQDYAGGSYARGQAANGGGGGNRVGGYSPGGGGGANGGTGGTGQGDGNGTNTTTSLGGDGGSAVTIVPATSLYLGGGGGGGVNSTTTFLPSSGSTGGGIIILRAGTASGTATISANGSSGQALANGGGGGGGAGGTVVLNAASLATLTVNASGGNGGNSSSNGNGGGGGGGAIFSNTAVSSSAATAGANGTGAADGTTNASTTIGGACLPALTTVLRTTVPNVLRSSMMQTTYAYTVSNTGGGITGLAASPNLAAVGGAAGLFTYASMASAVMQLTDGTSKTLVAGTDYTVSSPGSSTPTFTLAAGSVVPSGASVVFTFVATITNAAVTGTAYGSNAVSTYLNPQRTTATATLAAPAYTSTGSSADVVTIVVPLPVQLTRFVAVAVGPDALLNWETAQEVNNHHFEVERSLDGTTFASIGLVAGKGNSLVASTYYYTDAGASARTADVLYYRLRQVDYDGESSFSPVQTVRFRHAGASVALYPNPATSAATLDLSQLPAGDYTVQVFETTGRLVQRATYQAGKHVLSLESLPTGTYFVKVQGTSLNTVLPLIKQ